LLLALPDRWGENLPAKVMIVTEILVIDDDPNLCRLITDILRLSGFETVIATNGKDGLEKLVEQRPDLVLCDVDMPGVSGFDVLEALRGDPRTEAIPLLFVTARQERDAMRRGMELGADDYVTKPFAPAELLAAVNTQLKKQATANKYETALRQMRRNIVYALPHELRTTLFGISGYAQLIKMDYETIEREMLGDYADKILIAGERLERLIENFLVYAQLELISGDEQQVEELRGHIAGHVDNVVQTEMQKVAGKYGRKADVQCELLDLALQISEKNLRKIVGEVADNAFKFSNAGTPVEARMDTDGNLLRLTIRDSGRGMSTEQIERIGAFMQFDRMLHEQQGMGLGLSIAKRLTELHQGQMVIESQPGVGTAIQIVFQYQ